jgi:hypothetical protein
MKEYIDFSDLVNELLVNEYIETKRISDFCNCSVRLVQKWAKSNNVKYHRIKGIKYYIWDKEKLTEFSIWLRRNEKKKLTIARKVRRNIVTIKKEEVTSIKDLLNEFIKDYYIEKVYEKRVIKQLQLWCKRNNVQTENRYGRKYYIITNDIKKDLEIIMRGYVSQYNINP